MPKLTLTVAQRINLESIIRTKRSADGDDFIQLCELREKIGFEDDERKQYLQVEGNLTTLRPAVIKQTVGREFELEKAEVRKIQSLLTDWQGYTTDDAYWLRPLKESLKQTIKDMTTVKEQKDDVSA